jgi:hypothetical protein
MRLPVFLVAALAPVLMPAQEPVVIQVDAAAQLGSFRPIYSYFSYDEPNYTYMKYGPKLVEELSRLSYAPVYIRAHHLLCTGDGTAGLKWGSTNAYTEDANGRPVYDWTIVDRIFDTYMREHAKPFVEIGFMPEALSGHPGRTGGTMPRRMPNRAGPTPPEITISGRNWCANGCCIRCPAMGKARWRPGTGNCGMSRISITIGAARPRSTTGSTTPQRPP